MNKMNKAAAIVLAMFMAVSVVGCKKSKNSGTAAASADESYCERADDGVMRDEHGRQCSTSTTGRDCSYYRYDQGTGKYYDDQDRVVTCSRNYTGNGWNGDSCSIYDVMYPGNHYVAMNIGYNQVVCVNTYYLYNMGYQWIQQPTYYQYYAVEPIYTCDQYYGGCDRDRCDFGVNLSWLGDDFGASLGLCF